MPSEQMFYKSIIEIDSELKQIQDLDILLERTLLEARRVVGADAGSIYVKETVEEDGVKTDKLVIKYSQNDTSQKSLPSGQKLIYSVFSVPINEMTISGYCALMQEIVNVQDAYNLPEGVPYSFGKSYDQISGYKTTSILTAPLKTAEGVLLGVIQVINAKDKEKNVIPFTKNDEFLITHFAASTTVALQKAKILRTMILRMIKMAELRDPSETGSHVNRVAGYAVEIYDQWAKSNGIPVNEKDNFKDNLRIAAMLHDVGKVAVSDVILKKPEKLSPEEYFTVQGHATFGAALFDNSLSRLDELAMEISLSHHENWDGTGYPGWADPLTGEILKAGEDGRPLGKKAGEIPLAGRIVSIADVYDALTSRRVYKEPWSEMKALEEILKLSGTKFDPGIVDIFFEIYPNIKQIQELYPEEV